MSQVEAYSRLAAVYDEMVVDDAYPQWAGFLHGLWIHDAAGVNDVLDVCCGTGLMAAELISLGYRVVGTDASGEMLDRARDLLGPDAELHQAVLPEFPSAGVFDAVISTFDGLNYLSPEDLVSSVGAIAASLRADGWFCFDLHSEAMMRFTIANPVVTGESEGRSYRIESVIDGVTRECETTVTIAGLADGSGFTERHRQYFHSSESVRAALAGAGFDRVAVLDEYTHVPADSTTMRDTWVARRT